MSPFGLLAALLAAASGVTAAAFIIDGYFEPRMMPDAPALATTSTHQRGHLPPLATGARTRFVAIEARATPPRPKLAPGAAKTSPVRKPPPAKESLVARAKKPRQAAVQWPWSQFGD